MPSEQPSGEVLLSLSASSLSLLLLYLVLEQETSNVTFPPCNTSELNKKYPISALHRIENCSVVDLCYTIVAKLFLSYASVLISDRPWRQRTVCGFRLWSAVSQCDPCMYTLNKSCLFAGRLSVRLMATITGSVDRITVAVCWLSSGAVAMALLLLFLTVLYTWKFWRIRLTPVCINRSCTYG